jgi:ribonuclease III family protein
MFKHFAQQLRERLKNIPSVDEARPPVLMSPGTLPAINQTHPLVLAYVGDAVYELFVRIYLLQHETKVHYLHKAATGLVKAATQAGILKSLEVEFTEDERVVARRGRNAKVGHTPKNAAMIDYRHATGFECLLGYLFLTQQDERLLEILHRSIEEGQRIITSIEK